LIPSTRKTQALLAIQLPLPANDRHTSAFAALEQRKTTREISATPLPLQLLSNLLWAACGVNRRTGPFGVPGRTAASASNSQEIDLYVAVKEGVYLYDALNKASRENNLTNYGACGLKPGCMLDRQLSRSNRDIGRLRQ